MNVKRMLNNGHYDVVIVGGGIVGSSLACALGHYPLNIALIEAAPHLLQTNGGQSNVRHRDERTLGLSYSSVRFFQDLHLWEELKKSATPIKKIHISDKGHFGVTRLDSTKLGLKALGYVIKSHVLTDVLNKTISRLPTVQTVCPAKVVDINFQGKNVSVVYKQNNKTDNEQEQLIASLVVAADGGHSVVRKKQNINVVEWDYHQTAIVANVEPSKPHNFVAYERFTPEGPLAMLPLQNNQCGFFWTQPNNNIENISNLSDNAFLTKLQHAFGHRLGTLKKVSARGSYPLKLIRSREKIRSRLVLIGNAAHSLHPVAAQGMNLGIRDVLVLAHEIENAIKSGQDIGSPEVLKQYISKRISDHRQVPFATDGLVKLFSNRFLPLVIARNIGLITTDLVFPLKRALTTHAMGLANGLPRLSRDFSA